MGLQRFPYTGFKGINYRDAPGEIETGESYDAQNVQPIDKIRLTGLKERGGLVPMRAQAGSAVIPGNTIDIMYWGREDEFILGDSNGDLFSHAGLGADAGVGNFIFRQINGPVASGATAWDMAIAPDSTGAEMLWLMGCSPGAGVQVPQKYNGTTVAAWAGSPPNVQAMTGGLPSQSPGGILYWKNRMLVWNASDKKNRLFFSDKGNPESPTTGAYGNNFIDFLDDDSSEGITAVIPHQESAIVFRERGIWQVYDPTTFANKKLVTGHGTPFRRLAVSHPNGRFYWVSTDDNQVYSMSLGADIVLESDKISSVLGAQAAQGVAHRSSQMLVTPAGTILLSTATGVWELYPFAKAGAGAWFKHSWPPQAFSYAMCLGPDYVGTSSVSDLTAVYVGDHDVKPYHRAFRGLADDTTAINAFWRTSWRPFIAEEPLERLRRLHPVYSGLLAFDVYASNKVVTTPGSAKTFTPVEFAPATDRDFPTFRPETRGRFHQVRLRNAVLNKTFVLDNMEFVFRGGKEHA